jgi:hypothetical protein
MLSCAIVIQLNDTFAKLLGGYLYWILSTIYLCTFDLYGPVRNCFDAGRYIKGAQA